jgi:hypothetical protein
VIVTIEYDGNPYIISGVIVLLVSCVIAVIIYLTTRKQRYSSKIGVVANPQVYHGDEESTGK